MAFFADGNFGPYPRNHWIVGAVGASGGGPTWTQRGVLGHGRIQPVAGHSSASGLWIARRGGHPVGGPCARAIAAAADGGPGRFQSQVASGDCLKPASPKIAAAPSYGRDSAPALVTSCGGSSAPEETMQPNDPVGELKTNGPSPTAVPAEMPDSRVNGGASPELLDLLNALQSMRVGDFSV